MDKTWSAGGRLYHIKAYLILVGARIRCQTQYRASFVLDVLGTFASAGADLVVLAVLFTHVEALAGWRLREVALLYGMTTLSFALSELFFGGFSSFSTMVRLGQFDGVLMRPLPDFLQVLTSEFLLRRLARAALGVSALVWAISNLQPSLTGGQLAFLSVCVASGAMAFGGIFVVQAATCFWTIEGMEAYNILTYGGTEVLSHPLDIYTGWLRKFFLFILPMAFVNYVPAAVLLGKRIDGIPPAAAWLSPLVGPVLLSVARSVWRFGVARYKSTGS